MADDNTPTLADAIAAVKSSISRELNGLYPFGPLRVEQEKRIRALHLALTALEAQQAAEQGATEAARTAVEAFPSHAFERAETELLAKEVAAALTAFAAAAVEREREKIAASLGLGGPSHARHNLDGAIIDAEHGSFDEVCLRTMRRRMP